MKFALPSISLAPFPKLAMRVLHGATTISSPLKKRSWSDATTSCSDGMLPGIDGFEVLRRLRATKIDTRVLILTARGEVSDRVTGLGLGADDYPAKPFAMQELVARVSALGRRFPEEAPIKLQIADLVLNLVDRKLYRGPRRIEVIGARTPCCCAC